jgi:hypothetical protein
MEKKVIDNNGKVYDSVTHFASSFGIPRTTVSSRINRNKVFSVGDITITFYEGAEPPINEVHEEEVDKEFENYRNARKQDFNFYEIKQKHRERGYRYAIALFSDAHIEETVEPSSVLGKNEYNVAIAEERIKTYFANLASCIRKDDVNVLFFASLGDTISGFIHEELSQENGLSPLQATAFGQSLIISGLKYLRNEFPALEITFIGISGNHSRTTKKIQHANGFKMSYEWLMYKNIEKFSEMLGLNISFIIPESEVALVQTPDKKRYIFCHGYQVQSKGTGTVAGIYPALGRLSMKWRTTFDQDKIFLGHYHTCVSIPTATVNGSIIGYNAFALTNGMGCEEPAQQYEVYENGKELLSRKIYCK